jgi:hypothetical protein
MIASIIASAQPLISRQIYALLPKNESSEMPTASGAAAFTFRRAVPNFGGRGFPKKSPGISKKIAAALALTLPAASCTIT